MGSYLFLLCLFSISLWYCTCISAQTVSVTVNWNNVTFVSKTSTTLQMVMNPLVTRAVSIHDRVYSQLRALQPPHARFQAWFPYPKLSVPELDPPSGLNQCRNVGVGSEVILSCARGGGTISKIDFASFGTPAGLCGGFSTSSCNAANSSSIVSKACLNQRDCVVPASMSLFGNPCPGQEGSLRLAVQVQCDPPQNNTYWNFTGLDGVMEDWMAATAGLDPSLDLSTFPSWMYVQSGNPHHYPDSPYQVDWGYETGNKLVDPTCTQVGEFYGRIAAWYMQGGFEDEYGYRHNSPYHYPIRMWEVLNEMEHGTDIQTYTCIYDAVVIAVRRMADPDHLIKFVGLAEENPAAYSDYEYFLNISNHVSSDIPFDWISYHRYATDFPSRTSVAGYENIFTNYAQFFDVVNTVESIRMRLSPTTRTTIDEIGVILPSDNDPSATDFPRIYFNACAAGFAYLFGHLSAVGIDVLGSSQLMGYPNLPNTLLPNGLSPQYPSVTMVNWTTGAGTSRWWVLDLLLTSFQPGDRLLQTTVNPATNSPVFAQAYHRDDPEEYSRVLLVNTKSVSNVVQVAGASGGYARIVDEQSGEQPARRERLANETLTLAPFAVAVITLNFPTIEPIIATVASE